MLWETAKADHRGGRPEQQDRALVLDAREGTQRLLAVADGMGPAGAGAVAAEAVIEAARDAWHRHLVTPQAAAALLADILTDAHGRIRAGGNPGVGSTCVLFHADDARATWAWVGDSRLYRFRGGTLEGRTKDHSVVQILIDHGKLPEDQAERHPERGRLSQSLGGEREPQPGQGAEEVRAGDGFLVCSDGLWRTASVEEMAQALAAPSLGTGLKSLAAAVAERAGAGGDNIAVAAARAGRRSAPARRPRGRRRAVMLVLVTLLAAAAFASWYMTGRGPVGPVEGLRGSEGLPTVPLPGN